MNGWKSWLGVISVFVIGAVIGGLVTTALIRNHVIRVTRFGPPRFEEAILDHMARDLDLTDEQRDDIRLITREFDPRFREIMNASREEVRRLQEELEARIKEILTPGQIERFEENIERMHRRRPDHGGKPGERWPDRTRRP
jgi:Spy/CpxP family protein refolding chaperone